MTEPADLSRPAPPLLLVADRLVVGMAGVVVSPAAVLVADGRVVAAGTSLEVPDGIEVRHYPGGTILPGLIDCHVHLTQRGLPDPYDDHDEDAVRVLRIARHADDTLRAGVTTVRDCGGRDHLEMGFRRAVAAGLSTSPRLVLCGRIISVTTPGAEMWPGMYHEADGADAVRRAVRDEIDLGADFIKVMATGSVMAPAEERPGSQQYTTGELRSAVETAHALGRRVAAHAHGIEGLRAAVVAGVDTIEHGTMLHIDPHTVELMASQGTFLIPTLKATTLLADPPGPGIPDAVVEKAREVAGHHVRSVAAALHGGVRIAMGTDAATSFNRHGENRDELALMVEAGLTPIEAIVAATGTAAAALGLDDEVGTVAPGRRADLIVVDGDPLADMGVLKRSPRLVLQAGVPVTD